MFLHVGNSYIINTNDIVGIFDMDNTTVSRIGREFLSNAQKQGLIVNTTEELPKSYILANSKEGTKVYISSISSQVLLKRAKSGITQLAQ